jgi:hypothetical protein
MKFLFLAFALVPLILHAQEPAKAVPPRAYADPSSTDLDFPFQGEYIGGNDGKKLGVQVIALGQGEFEAVGYVGGLPGAGWDGDRKSVTRTKGKRGEGATSVHFEREGMVGEADGVKIYVRQDNGKDVMELTRVNRSSPTLGAKPPEGAIVLFGGKDANRFTGSSVTEDGLLTEGAMSQEKFRDFSMHIEFRLPYMPSARGQSRANSGLYLQGRYELQMLDSFGLEGKDNQCGGIYTIAAPKQNLCFEPLVWQTYDIDFTAAQFDSTGKKTANAKVSVKHNGVMIHENQEIPGVTAASPQEIESAEPGPIFLQNHGNPVRYRNIWVVRK